METKLVKNKIVIGESLHVVAKNNEVVLYDQVIPGPSIGLEYLIFMLIRNGVTAITVDVLKLEEKSE